MPRRSADQSHANDPLRPLYLAIMNALNIGQWPLQASRVKDKLEVTVFSMVSGKL